MRGTGNNRADRLGAVKAFTARGVLAAALTLPFAAPAGAAAPQPPAFSSGTLAGWAVKHFDGRHVTQYGIARSGGSPVLQAICRDSASGLIWKHRIDLDKTPVMSWRWKIAHVYAGLDPHAKSGDDYPARVYVVAGNPLLPWTLRSLVYVWANGPVTAAKQGPHGTKFYPDPYTSQAEIVALRQGPDGAGGWVSEQRNLKADLARAFGGHRHIIGAVAVMTDCDDSHSHGRAWYGDIRLEAGG
ncbi:MULTISPECIES: DUF3047 domain-containing protein [unclassified Acidiphilium]|uniref:DUF3047 domain-containing protein n=1 Tax=unclassified Acidiphilium TaxID=2617493 RepID=UPI000BD079A5|nr:MULTISPECIES: DUF3047 domain-containing protein [unclassified Acidiphilium]OYV56597.1 MAG: hypothetical protein B7Z76_05235 [Acidiphilium sp. 20-67-58]HQT62018.1 DUF3047 domain-containing protein [Acidiphilium sp.]